MKRITGLAPPYSVYFVCTILGYVGTTAMHYILVAYLEEPVNFAMFALSGVLTAAVILAWFRAVTINPEPSDDEENPSYYCFQVKVKRETRYCPDCKKMVFELDHHCYFLNTCVGAKNYTAFLAVVIVAAMQMLLHIGVCLYFQLDEDCMELVENSLFRKTWVVWLLALIHLVVSALQAVLLLALLSFHTYLSCVKHMGTFDWMLERRMKKSNRPKGSRYSTSNGDENSMSSRMSEAAISAAKQRQIQREDFERSLAAGKKKGFEFFRSGNSSPSLLGSSLKKLFSFRDASVVDESDDRDVPQLADLDLGNMEAGSGRYLENMTTIRDSNRDINIAAYIRSNSSSISSGKKLTATEMEKQESTVKIASMVQDIPTNVALRASVDLAAGIELAVGDDDATPLPSDEDQEAVMKKRLRKTDLLLKQTLMKTTKVFPSVEPDNNENTLDRVMSVGSEVARTGAGVRGSMMTVSYDSNTVSRSQTTVTTEDAGLMSLTYKS